jgi:alpha-L-fucosidase
MMAGVNMRVIQRSLLVAVGLGAGCLAGAAAGSASPDPYAGETAVMRDTRMQWWREARFGLFIHWGVYSVPAGRYHGKPVDGIGEWIMYNAQIPCAEYRGFAKEFNPVRYNPDDWVRLARDAGMKYIVITSKHHDGFALFDSKASDWNVVKATPYGKDLLKPLAEACQRHGLKLGFYYSQAQDWNNRGGIVCGRPHWDRSHDGDTDAYIRDVAAVQVRELLTGYGPLGVFWWDTPCDMTRERADVLLPLLRLQPGVIHNNRLGIYPGDTDTPEQEIPATGMPGRDWETCMTMNDTWGFKSDDQNWKSTQTLVRNLVDIASKGGNYLLNVGPTRDGLIPEASVQRLREVGRWMRVNGTAIHGTTASPFKRLPWGRATKKAAAGGATLYLHVFDWPADGRLDVPGLKSPVKSASLLASGERLSFGATAGGLTVRVPSAAPDAIASTVVLELAGPIEVEPVFLTQGADGAVLLPAVEATIHGSSLRYEPGQNRDNLGFWLDPADWADWSFTLTRPGRFAVRAEIAALGAGSFEVSGGTAPLKGTAPVTGDYGRFQTVELGTVELPSAGRNTLAVRPIKEGWQPINLKAIRLSLAP